MASELSAMSTSLSVMRLVLALSTFVLIVAKAVFPDTTSAEVASIDALLASAVLLSARFLSVAASSLC